jgi:hypothetical protein
MAQQNETPAAMGAPAGALGGLLSSKQPRDYCGDLTPAMSPDASPLTQGAAHG